MSKWSYDIFAFIIISWGPDWQPKDIAIGFFEASNTFRHALNKNLTNLSNKYDLKKNHCLC
jgi:hypothetical protein